jgi:hypothetical protein
MLKKRYGRQHKVVGIKNYNESVLTNGDSLQALDNIIEKFQISNEDAIIIKEICEEVAEQDDIKSKVIENKDNEIFLNRFEPNEIQQQIKNGHIARDMWDKLEDEIYIGQGGIIPLMGKTAVGHIVSKVA